MVADLITVSGTCAQQTKDFDGTGSTILYATSDGRMSLHTQPTHHPSRPQTWKYVDQWRHAAKDCRLWTRNPCTVSWRDETVSYI